MGFGVEMWMAPPPVEVPEAKVVGSWVCRCGLTKWGEVRASAGIVLYPRCLHCGDSAELLPLPFEGTT